MNDLEINKAVAEKLGGKVWFRYAAGSNIWSVTFDSVPGKVDLPDYCNNWQDAGPIIEKYRISLLGCPSGEGYDAYWESSYTDWKGVGREATSESPLKTAMICFLLMEIKDD